ncbi:hypothetical protein SLE2022_369050 [Rubroshorea leprosula]
MCVEEGGVSEGKWNGLAEEEGCGGCEIYKEGKMTMRRVEKKRVGADTVELRCRDFPHWRRWAKTIFVGPYYAVQSLDTGPTPYFSFIMTPLVAYEPPQ